MISMLVFLASCNACNPPPVDPPPCDPVPVIMISPPSNLKFLGTDTINGIAFTNPIGNEASIIWQITSAIGGIKNVTPAIQIGPTISFQPDVIHIPGGSLAKSSPLEYAIIAGRCTFSDNVTIIQDEKNVIRQEYINHNLTPVPSRASIITPVGNNDFPVSVINKTAYGFVVGDALALAQNARAQYNVALAAALGSGPTDEGIIFSSGWRNPEKNETIPGSEFTSRHQFGDAVDFVVLVSTATLTGLSRNELFTILEAVGDAIGTGICEKSGPGGGQVLCTDPDMTHVHIQIP